MTAAIYTNVAIKDKKGCKAYNVSSFPCHDSDVDTIYMTEEFPTVRSLAEGAGLKVKIFSELDAPKKKGE